MLKILKQARAAFGMLNPEEVRKRVERPLHVGLVAASESGYCRDGGFPGSRPACRVTSASIAWARCTAPAMPTCPATVDLVLYEQGLHVPEGAYEFRRDRSRTPPSTQSCTIAARTALALARQFPALRAGR